MRKFLLQVISVFMIFNLYGCHSNNQTPENKSAIRVALQKRFGKKAKKKHGVDLSGLGFWGPDNYVALQTSFEYYNLLNEDKARFMIVDMAAIHLEEVNMDEKIRPYLVQFPYAVENLSIAIFPKKPNYEEPVHPDFVMVHLCDGKISYKTAKEGQRDDYYSEKTETFEEALEKLREQGRVPEYFKNYPQI
jgi:hypothetical protein